MFGIIAISLSLLVILGGMLLLAKSKKDSLGNVFVFTSYSTLVVGGILFVASIIGGVCSMSHHHGKSHSTCVMKSQCSSQEGHCSMMAGKSCAMKSHCTKSEGQCSGMCKAGSSSCMHHGGMKGMHHGAMKCKKEIRKHHDGAEVEIEVEEVEDDE